MKTPRQQIAIDKTRAAVADPQYDGLSVAELARTIGVSETVIRRVLKQEPEIIREWWHNPKPNRKSAPRTLIPMTAAEYERLQDAPVLLSNRPEVVNFW